MLETSSMRTINCDCDEIFKSNASLTIPSNFYKIERDKREERNEIKSVICKKIISYLFYKKKNTCKKYCETF